MPHVPSVLHSPKHVLYVATDVLTLGFLVYGYIFYAFGHPFTPVAFVMKPEQYSPSPFPPPPFPPPPMLPPS